MDERVTKIHREAKDNIKNVKEQLSIQNDNREEKIKEHKVSFNEKINIIDENIITIMKMS